MHPEEYVRLAMEEAKIATLEGCAPFAVVVTNLDGEVIWKDHDRIKEKMDPTAHGEINAIRGLCLLKNTLKLTDTIFYTTSEPCPTCLSAMIKARVPKIFYGAKTEASASLPIAAEELAKQAKKYPITVTGGVLADECLEQRERLMKQ